jgi:hypothetical protein
MKQGQFFKHPARSEWGIGEVLDVNGNKVRLNFEHGGVKILNTAIVTLDKVESASALPLRVEMNLLEQLCNRFHADLEHNRPNCNDGKMALNVLADMKRVGRLSAATKKQLLAWCYTEGNLYQGGVELAREICQVIYGSVLPRPDKVNGTSK